MNKCKKCDRDTLHAGDKYCGACVHNAYAELEEENAKLRDAAFQAKQLLWKLQDVEPYPDEIHYVGGLLKTALLEQGGGE